MGGDRAPSSTVDYIYWNRWSFWLQYSTMQSTRPAYAQIDYVCFCSWPSVTDGSQPSSWVYFCILLVEVTLLLKNRYEIRGLGSSNCEIAVLLSSSQSVLMSLSIVLRSWDRDRLCNFICKNSHSSNAGVQSNREEWNSVSPNTWGVSSTHPAPLKKGLVRKI